MPAGLKVTLTENEDQTLRAIKYINHPMIEDDEITHLERSGNKQN